MKTMKTYKIYAIRLAWNGRYLFWTSTVILNNLTRPCWLNFKDVASFDSCSEIRRYFPLKSRHLTKNPSRAQTTQTDQSCYLSFVSLINQ